eukprot:m51a1_g11148 hypothetical protein (288) ;mRNA; r:240876-242097
MQTTAYAPCEPAAAPAAAAAAAGGAHRSPQPLWSGDGLCDCPATAGHRCVEVERLEDDVRLYRELKASMDGQASRELEALRRQCKELTRQLGDQHAEMQALRVQLGEARAELAAARGSGCGCHASSGEALTPRRRTSAATRGSGLLGEGVLRPVRPRETNATMTSHQQQQQQHREGEPELWWLRGARSDWCSEYDYGYNDTEAIKPTPVVRFTGELARRMEETLDDEDVVESLKFQLDDQRRLATFHCDRASGLEKELEAARAQISSLLGTKGPMAAHTACTETMEL